jgi:glycogen operon protein
MATRIQGSPDLYYYRGPTASINFITCHDGFTLRDLFSYNDKHNEANGENNNDGATDNNSWNCGAEGETNDESVKALRLQLMKNAFCLLMLSRGVPMFLMGDEMGQTQRGNNNSYCQDNGLSWMNWTLEQSNSEILRFATMMIRFRQANPVLCADAFYQERDYVGSGKADISFHGTQLWAPDFSPGSRCLAFLLCGKHTKGQQNDIYVAMNMYWEGLPYQIPTPSSGVYWRVVVNTSMRKPNDIFEMSEAPSLGDQKEIIVGPRSMMVLVAEAGT